MRSKGFTLIELLAVIVILAIIIVIAVPNILNSINTAKKSSFNSDAKLVIDAMEKRKMVDETFDPRTIDQTTIASILGLSNSNYESIKTDLEDGKIKVEIVGKNKWSGLTAYGTYKSMNVVNSEDYDLTLPVITLNGTNPMDIEQGTTYNEPGATVTDNKDSSLSAVISGEVNINVVGTYTITYNASDLSGNTATPVTRTVNVIVTEYLASEGVNKPKLASGMTAIKWNSGTSTWDTVANPDTDTSWYDYPNKIWANAKTADGSMWVWIPRYAYQIASGYHTSTAGTINIKFLKNTTNTTSDSTTIYEDNATNTHYVKHPAFKFGTGSNSELTGIWVAKFEMSGTTASLDSKPGVTSLRNSPTVGNMFTASRNMETNNKYGWSLASGLNADGTFTTDTNNVDIHMMKNSEWGVVAYLSQSTYGKNAEITINSSSSYYTGGGSGTAYTTNTAQSTTGTIYGIYDISGGANEYVMGNCNNTAGSSGLTPSSINNKYIDRYPSSGTYSASIYGDAVYETSSTTGGSNSWYGDYAYIIDSSYYPWFVRGGLYNNGSNAGAFTFGNSAGDSHINISWRSVVLVGTGL